MPIWRIAAVAFTLAGCAQPPVFVPDAVQETALQRAQGAAVSLLLSDGGCSGTVVGTHTILTAAHCFVAGARLQAVDGAPVRVDSMFADGADHVLLVVDRAFAHPAVVAGYPVQGEDVFILGSPARLPKLYRRGYVAGTVSGEPRYVMPIFYGDSGAGVFDSQGHVIAVVSGVSYITMGAMRVDYGFSYDLHFTPAQRSMIQ